mmetsp:Transcript_2308/g.6665  ORF Transcript_2308/g.6665 Transcript_2308/m.6665 type:complete len:96 (+) Transcript_2308:74-361(+)
MAEQGGGEDAPAEKEVQEDPEWKKFFYECLDFFAMIGRGLIACFFGARWLCRRMSYPIKEGIFSCVERVQTWYHPYRKTQKMKVDVPTFAPDFQF